MPAVGEQPVTEVSRYHSSVLKSAGGQACTSPHADEFTERVIWQRQRGRRYAARMARRRRGKEASVLLEDGKIEGKDGL